MMKTCTKCGETQPTTAFYRHPKTSDGFLSACKECHKKAVRENRAAKIDYYREFDRQRWRTDSGWRERIRRNADEWNQRYPERRSAHIAVNNAVRDGRLKKPDKCECCGEQHRTIHGHHEDYSRPLDVEWLCPPCHKSRHQESKE